MRQLQHSHPPEEAQFDAIMAGKGLGDGRRNMTEAYLSFERTLQKRMAKEEAREHGGGEVCVCVCVCACEGGEIS